MTGAEFPSTLCVFFWRDPGENWIRSHFEDPEDCARYRDALSRNGSEVTEIEVYERKDR